MEHIFRQNLHKEVCDDKRVVFWKSVRIAATTAMNLFYFVPLLKPSCSGKCPSEFVDDYLVLLGGSSTMAWTGGCQVTFRFHRRGREV